MSDQTPIETLAKEWLQRQDRLALIDAEQDEEGLRNIKMLAAFAAHVEVQRPGKVLTDEEVGRIAWKCYPHIRAQDAGRNADMATKRSAGIELLRYARDNGYLAPAQPLSAQQVFDVVEEFIKQEAERVGTDQPTGLEYPVGHRHWNNMIADLRERLNKLIG